MKKLFAGLLLSLGLLLVSVPSAHALTVIEELQAQINILLQQISTLQAQDTTSSNAPAPVNVSNPISRQLQSGDKVVLTDTVNVRRTAGGVLLGQQYAGTVGTVIGGPISSKLNNYEFYTWMNVDFETGVDGWVVSDYLSLRSSTFTPPPANINPIIPTNVSSGVSTNLSFSTNGNPVSTVSGINQSGSTNSTSTVNGTFSVNITAGSNDVTLGTQAYARPAFTFRVLNGSGSDVTSLVSKTSGFQSPAGVSSNGNTFTIKAGQSVTIQGLTLTFAGKDTYGQPLTAGPYSIQLSGITYSLNNGATFVTNSSMDGQSNWRTNAVNIDNLGTNNGNGQTPSSVKPVLTVSTNYACGGNMNLSWTSVPGNVTYKIYRNGGPLTLTTNTSWTDINLTPGQNYSYTVMASTNGVDSYNFSNQASAAASASCTAAPVTPVVSLSLNNTNALIGDKPVLTWKAVNSPTYCSSTGNAPGWGGAGKTNLASDGTTGSTVTNLPAFTSAGTYTYTMICSNAAGNGNPVSVTVNVSSPLGTQNPVVPAKPALTASTNYACGGNMNLSWTTVPGNPTYKLFRNGGPVTSTTGNSWTDINLTPGTSYTYEVAATLDGGNTYSHSNQSVASASASCVTAPAPAVTFTASPASLPAGGGSTWLSWNATNASSCSIPSLYNATYNGASGSVPVSPTQTTTYTVNCSGLGGPSSASVTVNVAQAVAGAKPVVTISANPLTVAPGAQSIINWSATGAASCTSVLPTFQNTSGTSAVWPLNTTSYSVTCTNSTGSSTGSVTINVAQNSANTFDAIQALINSIREQLKGF